MSPERILVQHYGGKHQKKGGLAIQTLDEEADKDEDDETDDEKLIKAAMIILRGLLCRGYKDHAFLSKLENDDCASAVKGMKQKTIDSFFERKSTQKTVKQDR